MAEVFCFHFNPTKYKSLSKSISLSGLESGFFLDGILPSTESLLGLQIKNLSVVAKKRRQHKQLRWLN